MSEHLRQELADVVREAVQTHNVPGAAAGVLVEGQRIVAAHGVTNVEHPLPVDEHTLFQVGSITKTFTSAAVMLLVQERALALDDPVSKHLPDLGPATGLDTDAITVEHILSHQAGFDGDHLLIWREGHRLERLRDARRLFEPGTDVSYSNAAFSVAGAVIEAVSGEAFDAFVRDRLLLPLGMSTAGFTADEVITHRVAAPHSVGHAGATVLRGAGWQPRWELGPVDRAAGALIASVDHLLTWCGVQVDGSGLLSRESLDRLHTPVVRSDVNTQFALDWGVHDGDGVRTIEHGGLTIGYCSDLVVAPSKGVGVVCLTHAMNGGAVNRDIRRWALQRFAGIHEVDPEPDSTFAVDIDRVVGRYLHAFEVLSVDPGDEPGTFVLSGSVRDDIPAWPATWPAAPPTRSTTYAFFGSDHAVSLGDEPKRVIRFHLDADGPATALYIGRIAPRLS